MLVSCVMIGLSNPHLQITGKKVVTNFFDWINTEKCIENGLINMYENEPHITLLYGLDPGVGENMMYHFLKIKNRDLYNQLRKESMIALPEVVIDTFDNEDAKVLKINFDNSPNYEILKAYSDQLKESFPNTWQYDDYHPHATITYLKPETPQSVVDKIVKSIDLNSLRYNEMTEFILSESGQNRKSTIPIRKQS